MRRVLLIRTYNRDTGSEGTILFKGRSSLTLELPWRNNATGRSCIPVGTYRAKWWKSPSKGWGYRVYGVMHRDYILIHSANFAGDTAKGLRSDLLGCIALGEKRATYQGQRGLFISRPAVRAFNEAMDKQDFILEVKNASTYRIPV
jgi:hypothetical protein